MTNTENSSNSKLTNNINLLTTDMYEELLEKHNSLLNKVTAIKDETTFWKKSSKNAIKQRLLNSEQNYELVAEKTAHLEYLSKLESTVQKLALQNFKVVNDFHTNYVELRKLKNFAVEPKITDLKKQIDILKEERQKVVDLLTAARKKETNQTNQIKELTKKVLELEGKLVGKVSNAI